MLIFRLNYFWYLKLIPYFYIIKLKQTTMTTLKITTNATEAVKTLFTSIFGYAPNEIKNNGSFYWADQIGFSHIGKFIIKNELYNGK